MPTVRGLIPSSAAACLAVFPSTIRAGETYALPQDLSEAEGLAYWLGTDRKTFVAETDGRVMGAFDHPSFGHVDALVMSRPCWRERRS